MKDLYAKLVLLFCSLEKAQLIKTLEMRDAEIAMLRSRVPKKRIFLTNEERERQLELGEAIGSEAASLIAIVSGRTYKRWLARKRTGEPPAKQMGRKGTPETLRQIVVRLARENTWGYGRLVGEDSWRVICSPATFHPDDAWCVAQAESMFMQAEQMELPVRHLIRDQNYKYTERFDATYALADVAVEPTAPRAPNQNAFIERWIGSIRYECLNYFIAFGLGHLDYLVESYVRHYADARPHQRKDNKPLLGVWPELDDPPDRQEQVVCRESLAGVLKHYERKAA